jgi:hypothetical protein
MSQKNSKENQAESSLMKEKSTNPGNSQEHGGIIIPKSSYTELSFEIFLPLNPIQNIFNRKSFEVNHPITTNLSIHPFDLNNPMWKNYTKLSPTIHPSPKFKHRMSILQIIKSGRIL